MCYGFSLNTSLPKSQMKPNLLIIDDDEDIRTQMKWALCDQYEVTTAEDRSSALKRFQSKRPLVTLLDLGLPPHPNDTSEGMATLDRLKGFDASAKIIVVTGQGEKENALRAVGAGACDFMSKPVNLDELQFLVQRTSSVAELEREYAARQSEEGVSDASGEFEGMVGACPSMQKVFLTIKKVASSQAPVLILGESGTGKEMVANAIHRQSERRDKPFIAINCNAIPEKLIESELFGHEKGAFTDAHSQRKGLIEGAAGGTLFLDEIGDLPLAVQVKLLRFLQEKRFQRIGGRKEIEIDTRILAATNVDLREAVEEKRFREDLYYRLAVVVCTLPPLRKRGNEDIRKLAANFLGQFADETVQRGLQFSPSAMIAVCQHEWPGNVRELQNHIQRAVVMAEGNRVTPVDLGLVDEENSVSQSSNSGDKMNLKEAKERLEGELVMQALEKHEGRVAAAAKELGVARPTFYGLMEKLGISWEE